MAFLTGILLLGIGASQALVLNNAQIMPQRNLTLDGLVAGAVSKISLEVAAESSWNTSAYSTSFNDSTTVTYRCNGNDFGFDIAASSCFDAITGSVFEWEDPTPKTWGPRHTGVQYDFLLPQRFISRDGTCIVEPFPGPSFTSARASQKEITTGAYAVIQNCVEGTPSRGGVAKKIGEGGKLGVLISKQEPNVRCYGNADAFALVNSCQTILDRMTISNNMMSFGTGADVDVQLPYTLRSLDRKCIMILRSTGQTDWATWTTVWSRAGTVTSMCAKQGKKGVWTQIGLDKRLYLEVGAEVIGDDAIA